MPATNLHPTFDQQVLFRAHFDDRTFLASHCRTQQYLTPVCGSGSISRYLNSLKVFGVTSNLVTTPTLLAIGRLVMKVVFNRVSTAPFATCSLLYYHQYTISCRGANSLRSNIFQGHPIPIPKVSSHLHFNVIIGTKTASKHKVLLSY
jgi:hypothetical protein